MTRSRAMQSAATQYLKRDPVDLGQVLRRQRPAGCAHILLHLLRRRGAGDDAGHDAVAQEPTERQLEQRVTAPFGECLELADDAPVALAGEGLRVARILGQTRPWRGGRLALVFPAQQPAGGREGWQG